MRKNPLTGLVVAFAMIVCTTLASAQGMTPVFGPKRYTRATGAPQTFTDTFSHCGTQQCQIVVVNGNADGTNRVSSASISLNGVQIVGPSAFNQRVVTITKPVVLADHNVITTTLASKPGSFLTIHVECAASPAVLSLGGAGVSLPNPTTLLSAVPIVNTGTAAAENVLLTEITLTGGTLTSPTLPSNLGTILAGSSGVVDADFSGGPFAPLSSYPFAVRGTYSVGSATYCFDLGTDLTTLPASPGVGPLGTVQVNPSTVSGGGFPHQPLDFGDEINTQRWTVPIGPAVPGTPTPTPTAIMAATFDAPSAVVFNANRGLGLISGGSTGQASNIAEPSGASGGGVVFVTANWTAAFSTDGGNTFTQLDPTTIFPSTGVGFCCDQVVQYVPQINRFIWLLQGNGMRIASASPADIINSGATAWTYWDLTPGVFGAIAGTGFDYPDLAVGNNQLYMSWNAGFPCPAGCNWGHQVARTSLTGIQSAGTITIEFTDPANSRSAWGAHLTQNTGDEIFWAGHADDTHLTVWSLKEGSNTYFWRDVGISSWARNGLSSTTPDGQDWVSECGGGFPGTAVIGGTRVGNQIWFAWNAGTNNNFQQVHVEMVTLDRGNNFNKTQQVQIWNNDYAFAYPALATNACTGEVGLSFEYGGNGNYQNHVVGFWGDFVAYITTGSDVGTCRFGDYVTIRQAPVTDADPGNLFTAFGYGLNNRTPPATGTNTDVRYVLFGRPASVCNQNPGITLSVPSVEGKTEK